MALFLKTADINDKMLDIIHTARKRLILVSPYINLLPQWIHALQQAAARNVSITVIYGKKKQQSGLIKCLESIPGLSLGFMKNMHAKCYFNEQQMIIGSMNLLAYSSKNNNEIGVLLQKVSDKDAFNDALKEIGNYLIAPQYELILPESKGLIKSLTSLETAYCIRCANGVVADASRPLCEDCYNQTSTHAGPHFIEKYCHCCGARTTTSFWYPVCASCTRKQATRVTEIRVNG